MVTVHLGEGMGVTKSLQMRSCLGTSRIKSLQGTTSSKLICDRDVQNTVYSYGL